MPSTAVRLGLIAVALAASSSLADAQDIFKYPAFKDYPNIDSAVLFIVNVDRVRDAVVKPAPGEARSCYDELAIDGFRLRTVTGYGYDVAPGRRRFEFQHGFVLTTGTRKQDRIQTLEKNLTAREVYAWVIVCDRKGSNVVSDLSWLTLGRIGRLEPFAEPKNTLSNEAHVVRAVNAIVANHNAHQRVRRWASIDGRRLDMPAGLVAGADPQGLIDAARPSANCSTGTPVMMREGLTSKGQRLSLWLRCQQSPTPSWQTVVRIGGIDIEPKIVSSLLSQEPKELYSFYLWLLEQKLKPPADKEGHLAEEVRNILRGDAPLRALNNRFPLGGV